MIAIDTLFHYCGRLGVGLCGLCPLRCSAVSAGGRNYYSYLHDTG